MRTAQNYMGNQDHRDLSSGWWTIDFENSVPLNPHLACHGETAATTGTRGTKKSLGIEQLQLDSSHDSGILKVMKSKQKISPPGDWLDDLLAKPH